MTLQRPAEAARTLRMKAPVPPRRLGCATLAEFCRGAVARAAHLPIRRARLGAEQGVESLLVRWLPRARNPPTLPRRDRDCRRCPNRYGWTDVDHGRDGVGVDFRSYCAW